MKLIKVGAGITGFESNSEEFTQLGLSLDDLLIRHPSATFFCSVDGESMNDDGIHPDDILVVDRSLKTEQNQVVVCNFNGEFVCKRVDFQRRMLHSANPKYPSIEIRESDTLTIEGVVVCSIHQFV